jgi:hypothetical protein
VALKVYRCRRQLGAMQWDSPALNIHARFGALRMLTAWTPAHTNPKTITYAIDVTDETLRRGLGDPQAPAGPAPAPCRQIAVDDVAAMRELQTQIEAGERFAVAGRARKGEDGVRRVPISRWEPAA